VVAELLAEGSLRLTLLVLVVLVGGTLLEALWIRAVWLPYFRVALPLGAQLVPLPKPPTVEEGRTAGLGFRRLQPTRYAFWSDRDARSSPTLLHGMVDLVPARQGVALHVTWAPPWTPVVAALWLIVLGIVRGEAQLTVPIGTMMVAGMGILYLKGARSAARELRWALARDEDDPGPDEG